MINVNHSLTRQLITHIKLHQKLKESHNIIISSYK